MKEKKPVFTYLELPFLLKFLASNYPQRPDLCRLSVCYPKLQVWETLYWLEYQYPLLLK